MRRIVDGARVSVQGAAVAMVGACLLVAPMALRGANISDPALRADLETAMVLLAFAAAALLWRQFDSAARLGDLALIGAVLMLGLSVLFDGVLQALVNPLGDALFRSAELWDRMFVGAAFAAAALLPRDRLVKFRHPLTLTALASLAVAGGAAAAGGLLRGQLAGVEAPLADPRVASLLALAATAMLASAAWGFAFRGRLEGDLSAAMLAGAAILLACSSFYGLVPHSAAGGLNAGELLRAVAYPLLLGVAVRRELAAQTRRSRAVVLVERQRVARDLHDGIAQDLAFIAANEQRIAREMGAEDPVVVAARRALAVSRATINDLSGPAGTSARDALEAVAQELGGRFGIAVQVDGRFDEEPVDDAREQLTRIVREAIANAARHGGARHVIVSVDAAEQGVALRVVDDGAGIAGAPEGFGVRSMRERTAALGGQLELRAIRGGGTELQVLLP
ncbi:MAG: sensor histidine kinase [Solirubrobacteraceae bacterium]